MLKTYYAYCNDKNFQESEIPQSKAHLLLSSFCEKYSDVPLQEFEVHLSKDFMTEDDFMHCREELIGMGGTIIVDGHYLEFKLPISSYEKYLDLRSSYNIEDLFSFEVNFDFKIFDYTGIPEASNIYKKQNSIQMLPTEEDHQPIYINFTFPFNITKESEKKILDEISQSLNIEFISNRFFEFKLNEKTGAYKSRKLSNS